MICTGRVRVRLRAELLEDRVVPDAGPGAGVLTSGHVDAFEVEFEDGKLELVLHDEDSDEEFNPVGTLFVAPPEAIVTRPADSKFDFTGAAAGEEFWVLPQTNNPQLLFLGASAEEIDSGTFASFFEDDPRVNQEGEFVRINLVDFDGPGVFSLWQTGGGGELTVFMTTADGVNAPGTPSDTLFQRVGTHSHFNWGFSEPGIYELTVQASAFLSRNPDVEIHSEPVVYTFAVLPPGGVGVVSKGEFDIIDVELDDDELEIHVLDDETGEESDPAGAIFVAPLSSFVERPAGAAFDFLGIPAGQKLAILPQVEDPNLLFLGAGADEIPPGELGSYMETDPRINATGEYVRVELVSFKGPEGGNFFVYEVDGFGNPTVFFNTADGIQAEGTPSDTLFLLPGAHDHYNWAFTKPGVYQFTVQASAFMGPGMTNPISSDEVTYTFFVEGNEDDDDDDETTFVAQDTTGVFASSNGSGGVNVYNPNGSTAFQIGNPFPGFTGSVRVAVADMTGDGVPDVLIGTGPGVPSSVKLIDGKSQAEIRTITPFEASFLGGVLVSAGDVTGDGIADYVISPDEGGGPRVRIYNGANGEQIADFFAIEDPNFRGGVRTVLSDLNGDGIADLIVVAGFGGAPRVAIFDGASLATGTPVKLVGDFFIFEPTLRNGAFAAAGDFNGDGNRDLVFGAGPGGGPRVTILDGNLVLQGNLAEARNAPIANFFAGSVESRGGIRVVAKDSDGNGRANLIASSGEEAPGAVIVYTDDPAVDGVLSVDPDRVPMGVPTGVIPNGLFVG